MQKKELIGGRIVVVSPDDIAAKILPGVGAGLLPYLKARFGPSGVKEKGATTYFLPTTMEDVSLEVRVLNDEPSEPIFGVVFSRKVLMAIHDENRSFWEAHYQDKTKPEGFDYEEWEAWCSSHPDSLITAVIKALIVTMEDLKTPFQITPVNCYGPVSPTVAEAEVISQK